MRRISIRLAVVAALVGTLGLYAWAGEVGQCISAAAGDYKDCKASCKDDFQTAKDA